MYYLLFLMSLEFVLRFIYVVFKLIFPGRKQVTVQGCGDLRAFRPLAEGQPST